MTAPRDARPVIVGCGLTGVALSRSLSRAGIDHVLIGPAPRGAGEQLGESLNLEGSLDIVDYFPELGDRYLAKTEVVAHLGDMHVSCRLDMRGSRLSSSFYWALGYPRPPEAFLHVDRNGYDAAAFELVVADPHCEHIDALVVGAQYDAQTDRITSLELRSGGGGGRGGDEGRGRGGDEGQVLAPGVVFDASNHVRAVARHLPLALEQLGGLQRAVWGHCVDAQAGADADAALWHATHIVRLERELDGIDGLAWQIPLRGQLSIGVGIEASDTRERELVLEQVVAALARRELIPAERFAAPAETREIPRYAHFRHDRAWGSNWLLAGGTFCLLWFAASAGVSSGFAAANVAPHFLADPARYGPIYETLLSKLVRPHAVFDWLRNADSRTTSVAELERRGGQLVEQSVLRLAESARLRPGVVRHALAGLLGATIDGGMFDPAGVCVHASRPDAARRRASVTAILDAFAGLVALDGVDDHMHADVLVHIDRLRFRGREAWKSWARHSHATWPFSQLRFEIVSADYDAALDRLDVEIVAHADGRRSAASRIGYGFRGDQVAEIWTSRRNYGFLYGDGFTRLPGFAAHLGAIGLGGLSQS